MPQTKLEFGASIYHELGAKAFQLRCRRPEWRAVNIAVISWQSAQVNGGTAAISDPTTSEHSEELLLSLFDEYLQNLDLDVSEITGLSLYTERQPCTFHHGDHGTAPGFRQSRLPDSLKGFQYATFERRNCAARLRERFGDLNIFYTASTNDEHGLFISFARRWSALTDVQKTTYAYVAQRVVVNHEPSRFHVKCPVNHLSYIWVYGLWNYNGLAVLLTRASCPFLDCGQPV